MKEQETPGNIKLVSPPPWDISIRRPSATHPDKLNAEFFAIILKPQERSLVWYLKLRSMRWCAWKWFQVRGQIACLSARVFIHSSTRRQCRMRFAVLELSSGCWYGWGMYVRPMTANSITTSTEKLLIVTKHLLRDQGLLSPTANQPINSLPLRESGGRMTLPEGNH